MGKHIPPSVQGDIRKPKDGILHIWCFDCGKACVNDSVMCGFINCSSLNVKQTFYGTSNKITELRRRKKKIKSLIK